MGLTVLCAVLCAAATASDYKMVLCAAGNGSNGYEVRNPTGAFNVENYCGPAGDPAGNDAFIRLSENQSGGMANNGDYVSVSWGTVPWVGIIAAGGYTREPGQFNAGWRGRFWAEGYGSSSHILLQGTGVENGSNGGIGWGTTSTFASHLWPFPVFADYRRFFFELTCMRPGGCDRSGWNGVDANTLVLILNDASPVDLHLTNTGSAPLNGQWVRGMQSATYVWSDQGSGIRMEWVDVDGVRNFVLDHANECGTGYSPVNGEFARDFRPCSIAEGIGRSDTFNTAALSDGEHTLRACGQDYGQYVGLFGTGGASCEQATIRTDNSAPGAPAGLSVVSTNPGRYLDRFGARFALPPDPGSPIVGVRYYVTDDRQGDKPVAPDTFVPGTSPTSLSSIQGPSQPGAYTLHVALQDQVGFVGAYAAAPIPRDSTPPAAPQRLRVSGPSITRRVPRIDLAWQNVPDSGSPIDTARYQLLDAAGNAISAPGTVSGESPQAAAGVEVPAGADSVRVWLSDAEGNVGAPATVAVPRDETPPAAPQDLSVAPPAASRAEQGFDVRWRNLPDPGSPIAAAHYEVLAPDGSVAVGPRTVAREGIDSIADLDAPGGRGSYTLKLWLSDAEGNVGAPTSAPLAYECVRSQAVAVRAISFGLDQPAGAGAVLAEGQGATLAGRLQGDGDLSGAPVCVFGRVVTETDRRFLGLAMTGRDGSFSFGVAGGPSREFTALSRAGQREVSATATVRTQVRPTMELGRKIVRGRGFATFRGSIPGPGNDGVVVVLQVRDSKGRWRAFRRYRTRDGGRFFLRYRFVRTRRPTAYPVRAQVRGETGYPYEAGNSVTRTLRVVP